MHRAAAIRAAGPRPRPSGCLPGAVVRVCPRPTRGSGPAANGALPPGRLGPCGRRPGPLESGTCGSGRPARSGGARKTDRLPDMVRDGSHITRLLQAPGGSEQILPLVYDELRQIARRRMAGERSNHTLQATALVHEAYARLVGDVRMQWRDRRHFFGAAAEAMRRVLIDHARKLQTEKRGGDHVRVTLGAEEAAHEVESEQLLALDGALSKLGEVDAQAAEVVRLRFFAGLSVADVASALEISERSAAREWSYARAWLQGELERAE